jgi:uncharacterized repeat protein (TIGR04138 family)
VDTSHPQLHRRGYVSVWAGTFPTVAVAEAYFGIPDEIGVFLPADAFAADIGVHDLVQDKLEAHFEHPHPRPIRDLFREVTFAPSFLDQAVPAADRLGIRGAQGLALVYDLDYRPRAVPGGTCGPLTFLGAFPYVRVGPEEVLGPVEDVAREVGCPAGAVLFVLGALSDFSTQRRRERRSTSVTAREFCEYLLACRGEDTAVALHDLGLRRSEDVGRVVFRLVRAGLVKQNEGDSEADFQGLFALP